MATVRRTLEQARANARFDRAKLEATAEEDIRRLAIEDGETPDAEPAYEVVQPPRAIREKLGMTQAQFANALAVPLSTLQNWEQGRVLPDPAARSLLTVVWREPEAALSALSHRKSPLKDYALRKLLGKKLVAALGAVRLALEELEKYQDTPTDEGMPDQNLKARKGQAQVADCRPKPSDYDGGVGQRRTSSA
jgi:putative transcriptional regulator